MVKHIQIIHLLFDHFLWLVLKGLSYCQDNNHMIWSLLRKRQYQMRRKKLYMWDTETILLPYLKNPCTSFCLIKLYDLRCKKHFEGRLRSYPYVFHFQYHFKSCQLIWDKRVSVEWFGNCTAFHFFEDNSVFDCGCIFLLPSILKAAEK